MLSIWRVFWGIFGSLAVTFCSVAAVEAFSAVVHPFPEGFEGTKEEICAHVEIYPAWVLAMVVLLWTLIAFNGCRLAQSSGGLASSLPVGILLLVAVGFNQWMLPYPVWFEVANFVALPLAMVGAIWMVRAQREPPSEEEEAGENPSP